MASAIIIPVVNYLFWRFVMESYLVFKDLAIIVVFAKLFGMMARKLKAPQVVGEILAGLIIGPSVLGVVNQTEFILQMAEVGVVLLMFSAGLGTNLKDLLKTGPVASLIAIVGVVIPLIGGTLLYIAFYGTSPWGSEKFFKAVFIGVIMTATSVSITVQTLKELGKLKSVIGTTIVSAAIIDDVIGIIVLTFVIGYNQSEGGLGKVILNTILFFALSIVFGYVAYKIFRRLSSKYPHTQRIPILSLALCMGMAYVAEKYFGIADITGAYVAGVILCSIKESNYIDEKININSYMLFGPIFFASIGLKTNIDNISTNVLLFSGCFVLVAIFTKIIGCGAAGLFTKHSKKDSLRIGIGMMTRGEVALIVAQKGLSAGLIESTYFASVIMLIIVSSIITPILLKIVFREEKIEYRKNKQDISVNHS